MSEKIFFLLFSVGSWLRRAPPSPAEPHRAPPSSAEFRRACEGHKHMYKVVRQGPASGNLTVQHMEKETLFPRVAWLARKVLACPGYQEILMYVYIH